MKGKIEIHTEFGANKVSCKKEGEYYWFNVIKKDGHNSMNLGIGDESLKEALEHIEELKKNPDIKVVRVFKGSLFHFHTVNEKS